MTQVPTARIAADECVAVHHGVMSERATCPCCGYRTLSKAAAYEVCPVCLWEDDGAVSPNKRYGGPNGISLAEGQERYRREGRAHADSPPNFCARPPRHDEPRDRAWQPYGDGA